MTITGTITITVNTLDDLNNLLSLANAQERFSNIVSDENLKTITLDINSEV